MKRKTKIVAVLLSLLLCTNSLTVSAQEFTEERAQQNYINSIIAVLVEDGELEQSEIQTAEVVSLSESGSNTTHMRTAVSDADSSSIDAVQITTEDEEGMHQLIVYPFVGDSEITNVTQKSATTNPIVHSDIVYVLVRITYYYYNSGETNFYGPFYRPSLVTSMWKDGTGTCTVKSMNTKFVNAGYVCNLTNGTHNGVIYEKISEVDEANPTKGTTYVGNNISMNSNTGLSMLFNGIDTYSYVHTVIEFTYNGNNITKNFSAPTFTSSGLADG